MFILLPASCSNLTLNNGMVTITPMGFPILAGAVATHTCSDGYLLSGEMNRTCMTRPTGGGVWGGDALMCRGEQRLGSHHCHYMIIL